MILSREHSATEQLIPVLFPLSRSAGIDSPLVELYNSINSEKCFKIRSDCNVMLFPIFEVNISQSNYSKMSRDLFSQGSIVCFLVIFILHSHRYLKPAWSLSSRAKVASSAPVVDTTLSLPEDLVLDF